MYKLYAIIYDLKSIFHNYSPLYKELKGSGIWLHFIRDLWLIRTNENTDQIMNRIQPYIDKNDSVFITEVNNDIQGWLPEEAWDWIRDVFRDNLHPPPIDPTNLMVIPGDRELTFKWEKIIGVTSYYVRLTSKNITVAEQELDQNQTSIKITELENNIEYTFHIQNINNGIKSVEAMISGVPCCSQLSVRLSAE